MIYEQSRQAHRGTAMHTTAKAIVVHALKRKRVGPILQRISSMTQNLDLSPVLVSRLVGMDKGWEKTVLDVTAQSLVVDSDMRFTNVTQLFNAMDPSDALLSIHAGAMVCLSTELLAPTLLKPVDFVSHMAATTRLTKVFADKLDQPGDKLAIAAIYHDIGYLVMASFDPHTYDRFPELLSGSSISLVEHEQGVFQTDHTEVGDLLLRALQFPDYVTSSAAEHHNDAGSLNTVSNIIQLADSIALQMGCSMGLGNAAFSDPKPPAGLELNQDLINQATHLVQKSSSQARKVMAELE